MYRLLVLPDEALIDIHPDQTILQATLSQNIPHVHVCGSKARCSTCRVLILKGIEHCSPCTPEERAIAEQLCFGEDIRLACQTFVRGDITLRRLVLDNVDTQNVNHLGATVPTPIGTEKHLAILFADIRGFTPFAEALLPYDVMHVLNRHFGRMEAVVHENRGIINNFIGDGLIALFGLEQETDAVLHAVRAGVAMLDEVEKLKPYLEKLYQSSFDIRIGIHYGQVVVGSISTSASHKLTAIGDAVNFASRVESANKEVGTQLLISEVAYAQAREHIHVAKKVQVKISGKQGKHTLYQVNGVC